RGPERCRHSCAVTDEPPPQISSRGMTTPSYVTDIAASPAGQSTKLFYLHS
ncbi:unnamed protein product, partial [Nesidiocoris tenuis]